MHSSVSINATINQMYFQPNFPMAFAEQKKTPSRYETCQPKKEQTFLISLLLK